ncbi:MAG: acyloxyacyl hydrolase, partial [Bacteroidota bacterium]
MTDCCYSRVSWLIGVMLCLGSLTAQVDQPRSVRQLYAFFDQQLADSLSPNVHPQYPKVSAAASYGLNFLNGRFGNLFEIPRYWSTDFRAGAQTTGRRLYEQLYHYPEWGGGISLTNFVNDTLFGSPLAAYGYVDLPLVDYAPDRRWNIGFRMATGLSTKFRTYDPADNPDNLFISAPLNVYIDVGGWLGLRISPRLDLRGSASLVHFSNGALREPNRGINVFGARLQLQYHLLERPRVYRRTDIPEWTSRHGWFVYQAIGSKQLSIDGPRYLNTTTGLGYQYWSGYRNRWHVQLDYFYDRSNNSGEGTRVIVPEEDRDNPANFRRLGLFFGHEAIYNRWSLVIGGGVYVARRYDFDSV